MKIRRIDFYPDDFLVGVAGLSAVEIGVYWVLCSLIYSTGGPIRADDRRLQNITGLRKDHLERVLQSLESDAKVICNRGLIEVKRCSNELERATKRISKARENGAKGGRNKDLTKPGGFSSVKLTTNNQHTSTNKQHSIISKPKKVTRIPDDWLPSEKDIDHAKARGLDNKTIAAVGEQFKDHWQGASKNATSPDWSAKWRTWIKNHINFHGTGPWPSDGGRKASGDSQNRASVAAVRARILTDARILSGGRVNPLRDTPDGPDEADHRNLIEADDG